MLRRIITKAEFAREAGVTSSTINDLLKKRLKKVLVGKRINANHPDAVVYLSNPKIGIINSSANRDFPSGKAAKNEAKKREATDDDEILEIPENIQAFSDMTLRDLIEKFGTDIRFTDWLKATKLIEDINEKRLKNAETQGGLVSRKLMKLGVIGPIDAAHIKLLTDGSKTIARRVVAMHGAGDSLDNIEKFVSKQITSFIKPVKAKIIKSMRE